MFITARWRRGTSELGNAPGMVANVTPLLALSRNGSNVLAYPLSKVRRTKPRILAKREGHSASRMIANALSLYTLMPKEMRDALRLFAVFEQGRLDGYDGHCRQAQIRLCTARTSRTTAQIAGVEDLAGTGIADMAIAMAGNRDMRICACAGEVTEGGGSARGRFRALEIL